MMCKVLLRGLREAVSREHQLRERQSGGNGWKANLGRLGKGWEQPEPRKGRQGEFILSLAGPCNTPKLDTRL